MRQIKFIGKTIRNNIWKYGSLCIDSDGMFISESGCYGWSEVDAETIGQFTGLTDKNGKEIYEGDIIQDNNGIGVIMWFQTSWGIASYAYGYDGLKSYTAVDSFYSKETKEWTVIGNIHDNPELLTK